MKPFKAGTVLKTMSRGRNKSVHLSLRFFYVIQIGLD